MRLICQLWEESECLPSGEFWGVRPDGYSLHKSPEALKKFIEDYWAGMPEKPPDEYSRPSGKPYECEITDPVILAAIERTGFMRTGQRDYPARLPGVIDLPGIGPQGMRLLAEVMTSAQLAAQLRLALILIGSKPADEWITWAAMTKKLLKDLGIDV